MRKSSALAAVLAAASMLSACGSVDSSTEESIKETTAASSVVTTTTGSVTKTAPENDPSEETETTTKQKQETDQAERTKTEAPQTQPQTTTTAAPDTTTTTTTTTPEPKQDDNSVADSDPGNDSEPEQPAREKNQTDELIELVASLYGKDIDTAVKMFSKAVGVEFGYIYKEDLGSTYETDDGDKIEYPDGAEKRYTCFVSKNSESFRLVGTDFIYVTFSASENKGVNKVFINNCSDYGDLGEAAGVVPDLPYCRTEYKRLIDEIKICAEGGKISESFDTGYFVWYDSPAGTVGLCAVEEEPSDTTKPYIYYSFSIDS